MARISALIVATFLALTLASLAQADSLPYGTLGDLVFEDVNQNGIQDAVDVGIDGVKLILVGSPAPDVGFIELEETTTHDGGRYEFIVGVGIDWKVRIDPANFEPGGALDGLEPTLFHVGSPEFDSDADPAADPIEVDITLDLDQLADLSLDFGFIDAPPCGLTLDQKCFVAPPPRSADGDCDGKALELVLEYTGKGCHEDNHSQENKVRCTGDPHDAASVRISPLKPGKTKAKLSVTPSEPIGLGDVVRVSRVNGKKLGGGTQLYVYSGNSGNSASALLQSVKLHTSCSQPIHVGDEFGSLRLRELTSTKGGTVAMPAPQSETGADSCEIATQEGTLCEKKPRALTLRYLGGSCGDSDHDQNASKVSCSGDAGAISPVRLHVTNKDGENTYLDTGSANVALGGIVTATAANAGKDKMDTDTQVTISDAAGHFLQEVRFHTSCSQPLVLGDRFGSIQVVGFDTDAQGSLQLGATVEYSYEVSNTGPSDVLVSITDDTVAPAGLPGSPLWVPAGESVVLSSEAFVEGPGITTSHAYGETAQGITCEASDQLTLTAPPTPPAPFDCDKPIDAVTMIWDGAEEVRVKAWKGSVGSTLLDDVDGIAIGDELTIDGYAGSPNDVYWEVFEAGTSQKLGESKFHLSCSDRNMDGEEDCGQREGNAKSNSDGLINDWLLEGMVDAHGVLDCRP